MTLTPAMQALQDKVAEKILKARKRDIEFNRTALLLKMRADFKLALVRYARKKGVSTSQFIRETMADKIGFDKTLF